VCLVDHAVVEHQSVFPLHYRHAFLHHNVPILADGRQLIVEPAVIESPPLYGSRRTGE
jgi:hypothetical protein